MMHLSCVAISMHAPPSHRLATRHTGSLADPQRTTSPPNIDQDVSTPPDTNTDFPALSTCEVAR